MNSSVDLITSYVNYAICCFPEDRTELVKTVLPKDSTAKKYFYILLLEVIAGVNKEIIPGKNDGENLLDLLKRISVSPKLDSESTSIEALRRSVENFNEWLNHEFEYEIYSANISKNIKINIVRKDALYLIGNRCKHSLLRSNSILKKLLKIYKDSGVKMDPGTEVLILEDIDNWLFDDFGGYHFTKLCELSSKVYHGIVQYVRPVYNKCLMKEDDARYSYKIPDEVTEEEAKFEYYELLNRVRAPLLPAIETWEYLESRC
ncbi:MAG TPA: hypothetical protein VJ440_02975 [Candidatus Brocadiaceae bacterium]|nr:hypothetical protein [Candidatus Brocadiaceae bacterium]